jgi:hypothetical protein
VDHGGAAPDLEVLTAVGAGLVEEFRHHGRRGVIFRLEVMAAMDERWSANRHGSQAWVGPLPGDLRAAALEHGSGRAINRGGGKSIKKSAASMLWAKRRGSAGAAPDA